jgi:hypothetical protein
MYLSPYAAAEVLKDTGLVPKSHNTTSARWLYHLFFERNLNSPQPDDYLHELEAVTFLNPDSLVELEA